MIQRFMAKDVTHVRGVVLFPYRNATITIDTTITCHVSLQFIARDLCLNPFMSLGSKATLLLILRQEGVNREISFP